MLKLKENSMFKNLLKAIGAFLLSILLIALFASISAILVMILWNAVIPTMFGLKPINYIESFLFTWLIQILLKKVKTDYKRD